MIGNVITEVLSLMGMAHGYASGVRMEKDIQKLMKDTERIDREIEKLADNIYYNPTSPVLSTDDREGPTIITDLRLVKQGLEPVQKMSGMTILSSAYIPTPKQMLKAFGKNPWEFLDSIRPFRHSKPHSNPDMVPILFEENNVYYIGWQMKGTFPILFGCHYTPSMPFTPAQPLIIDKKEEKETKTSTPRKKNSAKEPVDQDGNKDSESETLTCAQCGETFESVKDRGCLHTSLFFLFAFIGTVVGIVIHESIFSALSGLAVGVLVALIISSLVDTPRSQCPACGTPVKAEPAKN